MKTLFGLMVIAAFSYIAYILWYVPRETAKKSSGSRLEDVAKQAKK